MNVETLEYVPNRVVFQQNFLISPAQWSLSTDTGRDLFLYQINKTETQHRTYIVIKKSRSTLRVCNYLALDSVLA